MNPASVLLHMENKANYITNALKSQNSYSLIVVIDDNITSTLSLFVKFDCLLKAFGKKFILITSEKTSTYESMKRSFVFQEEEDHFSFNQLIKASQGYLKNVKRILFQGNLICLSEIISETFNSIDAKTVMQLTSNQTMQISTPLEPYKEYDEKTYIERKIGLNKMNEKFYTKSFSGTLYLVEVQSTEQFYEFLSSKNIDQSRIYTAQRSAVSLEAGIGKKPHILKTPLSERNDTKRWDINSHFYMVYPGNVEKSFQQMSEERPNLCIYWFKLKYDNLFLFQCSASAFDQRKTDTPLSYIETYYEDEKEAVNFLNNSKTVIITDSPGMGKSTILTNLSQNISDNVIKWKVRIDLNKYTKQLLELKELRAKQDENCKDIGRYVIDKLCDQIAPKTGEKSFAFRIFDEMYRQSKVLFIFDGFDEISPDYENLVLKIFEKIRISSKNHLWITSRLNTKYIIENKLKSIAYTIMPFSVDDQIEFLKKFWKNNWTKIWTRTNERHLQIYTKYLITEFNTMTKRNDTDIIGIPLHTKMLADVFQENEEDNDDWQSCFKFIKDTAKCDLQNCDCFLTLQDEMENLLILFEAFVKKHITRHLIEKKEIDNTKVGWTDTETLHYNEVEKVHSVFGIFALTDDKKVDYLLNEEERDIKTYWLQRIKTGNASFGLISHVSEDDKPLFTHLTFAEFFAAKFLTKKLLLYPLKIFEVMDLIMKSDVPVFIYCVKHLIKKINKANLERALENITVLNYLTKHCLINCLKYFIADEKLRKIFPQIDKFGKTPLHYAAELGHIKCIIILLLYKYNRLTKDNPYEFLNVIDSEIDDDLHLMLIEKKVKLFSLQEFIILRDAKRKSAVNYSKNLEISNLLYNFIKIGKKDLIPKNNVRTDLTHIQFMWSKYDFIKVLNGEEPKFSLKRILCSCSLTTILTMINNCELLCNENFLFNNNENFFDYISARLDIEEDQRICFFNTLLMIQSLSEWKQRIVKSILRSSIMHDNWKEFKHFFNQENFCQKYDVFNSCFYDASEANKLKFVEFLFDNLHKRDIPDLSDFLSPVKTNMIILKTILKQFEGDIHLEERYASKVLLRHIEFSFSCPSIKKIKYLLSKRADIHFDKEFGQTALECAFEHNYYDVIKVMVPYIRNLKIQNVLQRYFEDKNQIIVYKDAFELEDEKFFAFLIHKSPDVNMKDEKGKSLLFYACNKGWIHATQLLLEHGACYEDVFDENGELYTFYETNDEITTLLKKTKFYFMALLKEPKNLLETSKLFENFEDTKVSLHTVNKENEPLWFVAAKRDQKTSIIYTFDKTFCCNRENFQNSEGNTALHLAAKGGFTKIVEFLLENGAYYNIKNYNNKLPQDLTKNNDIRLIFNKLNYLFETINKNETLDDVRIFRGIYRCVFHARDYFGRMLLHYAVINGSYSNFMKIFEEISMRNINVMDVYQKTPLYYAIKNNNVEIVKTLFQHGAKLKKEIFYETIEENECKLFISIINKLFKDIKNSETEAFVDKMNAFCEKPISGFNIYDILDVKNDDGKNLFKQAVESNNYDLVMLLMEMGAVVYPCDDRYATTKRLLKFVFENFKYIESEAFKTSSIIRLLKKNKCVKVITKVREWERHDTLLHKAVEVSNLEMVKWLLKNGADLSATNEDKETALCIAKRKSNKNVLDILTIYKNKQNCTKN